MCGIAGIFSNESVPAGLINRMTDQMVHRGPDGFGYYEGDTFAFGHRRLSIVDLSDSGHQPMLYDDRYVITYNGEIYNHVELRQTLESSGYTFFSDSDTEVILAAYDCWGTACLDYFNGMWAFSIVDLQTKKVFISRDRFGIKPLYYAHSGGSFIFASEIKAMLCHPDVTALPNIPFINQYLKSGATEYNKTTAVKNVFRMSPATYFHGSIHELTTSLNEVTYWKLDINTSVEKFDSVKAEEYAKRYYDLLHDAVRIRLRADVKVGSALSGGLDSSSIVYLVNQTLKSQGKVDMQETFSCVYKTSGTEDCDESTYINEIASSLNVSSNQIEPKVSDVAAEHRNVIYAMENPPNSTLMSSWHTFKLVGNSEVTVTLDGQGADEQLAGYVGYLSTFLSSLSLKDFYREAFQFLKMPGTKRMIASAFFLVHARKVIGDTRLKKLVKRTRGWDLELDLNKRLADDLQTSLLNMLHYADHTSMAHSVESRMPFMDYRMVEFLASVPACYKIHNGWTKYLARKAFSGLLPDSVCWRKDKMGWPVPETFWFNGPLKSWIDTEVEYFDQNIGQTLDEQSNIQDTTVAKIRKLNVAVLYKLFFRTSAETG